MTIPGILVWYDRRRESLAYGGMGAAAGTGIGALIGALAKKRFLIGGRKEKFDEMKADVLTKVYGNVNTK